MKESRPLSIVLQFVGVVLVLTFGLLWIYRFIRVFGCGPSCRFCSGYYIRKATNPHARPFCIQQFPSHPWLFNLKLEVCFCLSILKCHSTWSLFCCFIIRVFKSCAESSVTWKTRAATARTINYSKMPSISLFPLTAVVSRAKDKGNGLTSVTLLTVTTI